MRFYVYSFEYVYTGVLTQTANRMKKHILRASKIKEMKRQQNIEYTIGKLNKCFEKQQALEIEQNEYENRLAKIVIAYLWKHERKKLSELDRTPFGMFMHNAQYNEKSGIVTANLWYSHKNEDGTETSWCQNFCVKMRDLIN